MEECSGWKGMLCTTASDGSARRRRQAACGRRLMSQGLKDLSAAFCRDLGWPPSVGPKAEEQPLSWRKPQPRDTGNLFWVIRSLMCCDFCEDLSTGMPFSHPWPSRPQSLLPISWRLKKPVGIQELGDNQLVPGLSQRASGPSSGPPGLHIHLRVFPPEPIIH